MRRDLQIPAPPQQAAALRPPGDVSEFACPEQWAACRRVLDEVRAARVPFAFGGGLAVSMYTGVWRPTKDFDFYVLPEQRDAVIEATRRAGMADYYDQVPYDRSWIYRAYDDSTIVDVIWAHANGGAQVDETWVVAGPQVLLGGEQVRLVPAEELIWSKVHVLQRERCDWPDILNMLYAAGEALDWNRLLARLAGEERLLGALLQVFAWLAPARASHIPPWVWRRLPKGPEPGPDRDELRINRLDSRPWFAPPDP